MKKYEELTFTDDYMFCKIMQQNEDLCKRVVEVIIGRKIGKIIHNEKQKPIDVTSNGRGIRMDVILEDDENTIYNIEMQNADTKNIAKRSRYYQGMLDADHMERGWEYEELKKSYIIFINMFDMFEQGLPKYTFTNRCHEKPDLEMGDDTIKIFLNAQGICDKIEPEIKSLITYLSKGKPTSELTEEIDTRVVNARTNPRWRTEFMTLAERYYIERKQGREEGIKQGLEQGRADSILTFVKNALAKNMSIEEACEIAGTTVEEYNKLLASK